MDTSAHNLILLRLAARLCLNWLFLLIQLVEYSSGYTIGLFFFFILLFTENFLDSNWTKLNDLKKLTNFPLCLFFYLFLEVNNFLLRKIVVTFMPPYISLQEKFIKAYNIERLNNLQGKTQCFINMSYTFNSWIVFSKVFWSETEICSFRLIKEYASTILSCSAAFVASGKMVSLHWNKSFQVSVSNWTQPPIPSIHLYSAMGQLEKTGEKKCWN